MPLYLLHPAFVHFPLAFLILGLGADAAAAARASAGLRRAGGVLLWLGAGSLWIAVGLGLLAERTAPHVPSAWEVLAEHRTLAFVTAGVFSAQAILRAVLHHPRAAWLQAVLWLAGAALLAATAYHGGELVYRHGMGVTAGH